MADGCQIVILNERIGLKEKYNFIIILFFASLYLSPLSRLASPVPAWLLPGLGGCLRRMTTVQSDGDPQRRVVHTVNLSAASRHSVRVHLDGCSPGHSRFLCRGNDSALVYSGSETHARDYQVQPFTGEDTMGDHLVPHKQTNKRSTRGVGSKHRDTSGIELVVRYNVGV